MRQGGAFGRDLSLPREGECGAQGALRQDPAQCHGPGLRQGLAEGARAGTDSYRRLRRGSTSATRQMEADMVRSTGRINQALAATGTQIGSFAKSFAVGLAGGVVAAAFAGFTSNALDTVRAIAEIGDEAKRSGLQAEAFQEWKYVAEQNRIGLDSMVDGFKELNLRADEWIATGSGPAAEAFKRIGFTAEELKTKLKDPSNLMLEIIGRLEGLDKAAQIRIADEIFGGTGGERFVELLDKGQAGIQSQIDRARELGIVMDSDMIAKAQELDAKFSEVTARMRSIWQAGVVEAATFFGFIEREREKLKLVPDEAAQVVGQELTDALVAQGEVTQEALEQIESLRTEYIDLGAAADDLAAQLNNGSNMLRGLGKEAEAQSLTELAQRIADAGDEFDKRKISGEEFAQKLRDVATEAGNAIAAMSDLDQSRLTGITGAVANLVDWIGRIPAAVAAAKSEIAGLAMNTGTPLSGNASDLMPPTGSEMSSSPRPKAPGVDSYGDWYSAANPSGGGGGGGGGAGNGRLDALVADLQTEREVLEEWYQESLDLLNSATEQQLEALGGKHEAIERLEREHRERMAGIQEAAQAWSLEGVLGAGADILGALGSTSKKALRISQGFAAAEAWISTLKGAARELEKGTLGFGTAAAVIAKGAAFVAAIKGTSENSTGGKGGVATGAQATPSAPPIDVNIHGLGRDRSYSGADIAQIFDGLEEESRRRGFGGFRFAFVRGPAV